MISQNLYIKLPLGRSIKKLVDCRYHQCAELIQKKLIYLKPLNHKSIKTLLGFLFVFVESQASILSLGVYLQARNIK